MKQMWLYSKRVNYNSPFPLHDTEYVNKLEEMKESKVDYDDIPVILCMHCKSIHIMLDEEDNDVCHRCGSINELETVDDMKMYDEKYGKIWKVVYPNIKGFK